ncbi:DUF1565 domain-containing protein [Engelhardtia mirabilis]|uniref:DUF1565 domain-containing protein n=1 Tax=Engelhardtia mirabilis TaxID=2528011 RepID=A0A518BRG4_9BACT|nr:hypothetical protein Pla133_46760 [Planctomycetes bacterium Pla133]QDV03882.1 hypothetical protein Pla86_46740 [Planctomycetes bacterium Pla86]
MNWSTGDDSTGDGSLGTPFKTITRALEGATAGGVIPAGSTVQVAGGSSNVYRYTESSPGNPTGEIFPLQVVSDDITIIGSRTPKPMILVDAAAEGALFPSSVSNSAILVDGASGFRLERLDLATANFDLSTGTIPTGLKALHLRDLPGSASAATSVVDCSIDDFFHGIFVQDTSSADPGAREITIEDTSISRCGPVYPTTDDAGHAGLRLLEATTTSMTLSVRDCIFRQNHDALEPGQANLVLFDTVFDENESGLEYAGVTGGSAVVKGCRFENHAPLDVGGVPGPTGGIYCRDIVDTSIVVRETEFVNNQLGASFRGLAASVDNILDLGSGYAGTDENSPYGLTIPGQNTFTVDVTKPWPALDDDEVSYVGLFNSTNSPVLAIGNTWTYQVPEVDWLFDCNQGGLPDTASTPTTYTYPLGHVATLPAPYTTGVVGPGESFDSSTDFPFHRPIAPSTAPQERFNFSTGANLDPTTPWPTITIGQ